MIGQVIGDFVEGLVDCSFFVLPDLLGSLIDEVLGSTSQLGNSGKEGEGRAQERHTYI